MGGDVRGRVDRLHLDGAQLAGNLDYTSNNQVEEKNGAHVAGMTSVLYAQPMDTDVGQADVVVAGWRALLDAFLAVH